VSDDVVPAGAAARLVRETLLRCVERTRAELADLVAADVDLCDPAGGRRWAETVDRITAEERERFHAELARWAAPLEDWERVADGAEVLAPAASLAYVLADFNGALASLRDGGDC